MKKLLVLCAGMMLLASAAMAQVKGLQFAWGGCENGLADTPVVQFSCDPLGGEAYSVYGTFNVDAPQTGIIAADGIVDFLYPNGNIPPFWHFEGGACNEFGLTLTHIRPATICPTTNSIIVCGAGGAGCLSFLTGYIYGAAAGFPENRARLFVAFARSATAPVTVTNTTRHFLFGLNFDMANAEDPASPGSGCAGCSDPVGITWNTLQLYASPALPQPYAVQSTDPGSSPSVGANCTACVTVNNKAKTWGQLKSLYR